MSRPAPNPSRYLRQLFAVPDEEPLQPVGFPRRTLAGFLSFTFLLGSQGITPNIFPAWLWDAAYIITGLVLMALAVGLHTSVTLRALAAFLAGATLAARTIALLYTLIVLELHTTTILLGLAAWPTIGVIAVTLFAFWHRLE